MGHTRDWRQALPKPVPIGHWTQGDTAREPEPGRPWGKKGLNPEGETDSKSLNPQMG